MKRSRIEIRRPHDAAHSVVHARIQTRGRSKVAHKAHNIGSSLFEEIIMPAIKSIISDFFSNGIDMMLFGERGQSSRSYRRRDYNRMSTRKHSTSRRSRSRRPVHHNRFEMDDDVDIAAENIIFDTRDDAKMTLARMAESIAKYDWVTMGDLYSFVGLASDHIHERYGWDSIDEARVVRVRSGYILDLPEPYFE